MEETSGSSSRRNRRAEGKSVSPHVKRSNSCSNEKGPRRGKLRTKTKRERSKAKILNFIKDLTASELTELFSKVQECERPKSHGSTELLQLWRSEMKSNCLGLKETKTFLAQLSYQGSKMESYARETLESEILKRIRGPESLRTECASAALAYYNEQNPDAEFELVEAIRCNGFVCRGVWYHVNFVARPKNTGSNNSYLKLFFAELNYTSMDVKQEGYICTCCILEPSTIEYTHYCKWCKREGEFFHPVGSYSKVKLPIS